MGRLGPGHGAGPLRPQVAGSTLLSRAIPLLTCSVAWNGTPGSGFAMLPVDPVRLTAKPACHLLVPPHQYFTDTLEVGVIAFANDGGTLIGGIDRVRFHFEGRSVDVLAPRWHIIATAIGARAYFGYWVRLQKPSKISGHAHLYAEAIPADATMQPRVIGPFQFSPETQLYDAQLTVTPSQPVVVGQNYHTVGAAIGFHRTGARQNTLITITEPLTEDLTSTTVGGAAYAGQGYCTIAASAPVTFARPAQGFGANCQIRVRINRLRFRGRNITFDMKNISALWSEPIGGDHWLDGCRFINSDGRGALWLGGTRPFRHLVNGTPRFTEVEFVGVPDCANNALLARGCEARQIYQDFCWQGTCAVDNRIEDFDSMQEWLIDTPSLQITYNGAAATATIALSGLNNAGSRTMTAVWGGSSANFVINRSDATYTVATDPSYNPVTAGTGYFVQDVAGWLNSLPGWSATALNNSRRASLLGLAGARGGSFAPQNVRNVTLQLVTCADVHADFYQRGPATSENVIIAFNRGAQMRGQNVFLAANSGRCDDFIVVGNAFSNTPSTSGPYGIFTQTSSQFDGVAHRHVVFAHNTMPTQRLILRSNNAAYSNDAYCLIANNAVLDIAFSAAPLAQHLNSLIANNVIDAGFVAPQSATGTVIGGDYISKHVDSLAGDFTPAGELLGTLFTPIADLLPASDDSGLGSQRSAGAF